MNVDGQDLIGLPLQVLSSLRPPSQLTASIQSLNASLVHRQPEM